MSGFPAGGNLGWCQGALSGGPPGSGNCGGPIRQGRADADGALTDPSYPVSRFLFVPALGRTVDCADPAERCVTLTGLGVRSRQRRPNQGAARQCARHSGASQPSAT